MNHSEKRCGGIAKGDNGESGGELQWGVQLASPVSRREQYREGVSGVRGRNDHIDTVRSPKQCRKGAVVVQRMLFESG